MPLLSGYNYTAMSSTKDEDNKSIEVYISGLRSATNTSEPLDYNVANNQTGAATGALLALMYFPLITIWEV